MKLTLNITPLNPSSLPQGFVEAVVNIGKPDAPSYRLWSGNFIDFGEELGASFVPNIDGDDLGNSAYIDLEYVLGYVGGDEEHRAISESIDKEVSE